MCMDMYSVYNILHVKKYRYPYIWKNIMCMWVIQS